MTHDNRPLFAANWKMHKGPVATREFVAEFTRRYERAEDRRVVVFPPSISVEAFRLAAADRTDLGVGVQDVHPEAAGAHTGAISASMAVEAGAEWSLVGHSERRREFGDDDRLVSRKIQQVLSCELSPIVCVGETLEERDGDALTDVLQRQVTAVLSAVAPERYGDLTWAYEPVWAIGTGRTASPEDASEAHGIIRDALADGAGDAHSMGATILYGGSVNPGNIESLMGAPGVNGVLVGGASLEPGDFAAICNCRLG
jgi:triosephosphate isomerase